MAENRGQYSKPSKPLSQPERIAKLELEVEGLLRTIDHMIDAVGEIKDQVNDLLEAQANDNQNGNITDTQPGEPDEDLSEDLTEQSAPPGTWSPCTPEEVHEYAASRKA